MASQTSDDDKLGLFVPLVDDDEVSQMRQRLQEVAQEQFGLNSQLSALHETQRRLVVERQVLEDQVAAKVAQHKSETKQLEKEAALRNEFDSIPLSSDGTQSDDTNGTQAEAIDSEMCIAEENSDEQASDSDKTTTPTAVFLEPNDPRTDDRIALASYPRSGNSLLRRLIESLTGVVTGSDSDPQRTLIKQLTKMGMQGEGVVDSRVWCVKTHYPERFGYAKLNVDRGLVLVRNPFDSIVSYFNMVLTQTHTHSLQESEFVKYHQIWDLFVREEIMIWKHFHAHWSATDVVPVTVLRYEDLMQHREVSLRKLARFLYKKSSIEGTEIERRVMELAEQPQEQAGVYLPRAFEQQTVDAKDTAGASSISKATSNGISGVGWGKLERGQGRYLNGMRYFTAEQIKFIVYVAREELMEFGYWDSFEAEFGPGVEYPVPGKCLFPKMVECEVVDADSVSTQDTHKSNKKQLKSKTMLRLNAKFPLRPRTKDDPYARGFGNRWKEVVAQLPPPRIVSRQSRDSSTGNKAQ